MSPDVSFLLVGPICSVLIFRVVSGKEVVLLMQALNTLATPEEKLAALCKKYADLVSRKSDTPTLSRYSRHLGAGDRKHSVTMWCWSGFLSVIWSTCSVAPFQRHHRQQIDSDLATR